MASGTPNSVLAQPLFIVIGLVLTTVITGFYLWQNPSLDISVGILVIWIISFGLVGLLYYMYTGGVDGFTLIRDAYADAEKHINRFKRH